VQLLPLPADERSPADELLSCPLSEIRISLSALHFVLARCFWCPAPRSPLPGPRSWSSPSELLLTLSWPGRSSTSVGWGLGAFLAFKKPKPVLAGAARLEAVSLGRV